MTSLLETSHSSPSSKERKTTIPTEHHLHDEVEYFVAPSELEQQILSISSFSLDDNTKQLLALGMIIKKTLHFFSCLSKQSKTKLPF
jgi:hypothetical protein